jgi:hypothetical protein
VPARDVHGPDAATRVVPVPETRTVAVPVRSPRIVGPVGAPWREERIAHVHVRGRPVVVAVPPGAPRAGAERAVRVRAVGHATIVPATVGVPVAVPVRVPAPVTAVVVVPVAVAPAVVRGGVDAVRPHVVTERRSDEERSGVVGVADTEPHPGEERSGADGKRDMRLRLERRDSQSRRRQNRQRCARHGTHGDLLLLMVTQVGEVQRPCQFGCGTLNICGETGYVYLSPWIGPLRVSDHQDSGRDTRGHPAPGWWGARGAHCTVLLDPRAGS